MRVQCGSRLQDRLPNVRRPDEELGTTRPEPAQGAGAEPMPKNRLKRDFDEVDKQAFRDGAFTVIRTYFEEAATEISEVEDIKSRYC